MAMVVSMKLLAAPDDETNGITQRLVSESGVVWMGVYRVLYGWRVRAGLVRDRWGCSLDWCCGDELDELIILYYLLKMILSARPEDEDCFAGLPPHSDPKTFYRDPAFVAAVWAAAPPEAFHRETSPTNSASDAATT